MVSQSLDLQQDALRAEGVEATNLYHDLASGVRDDASTTAYAPLKSSSGRSISGSPHWSGCTCPPRRPTTEAQRGDRRRSSANRPRPGPRTVRDRTRTRRVRAA